MDLMALGLRPKSGLPGFGTTNVSKSATADFDEPRNEEPTFA